MGSSILSKYKQHARGIKRFGTGLKQGFNKNAAFMAGFTEELGNMINE